MDRLLIATDLHQHPAKWELLVEATLRERPDTVLIPGDILPKHGGFDGQRRFFPRLRRLLTVMRDQTGACVLLYLSNDDAHFLEPLVDDLESERLCVNLNQRVHRQTGLVFCGMNKVRDYPFGYKHYCVPDGDWVTDPVQYCGEGITFNEGGEKQSIPDLRHYLLAKRDRINTLIIDDAQNLNKRGQLELLRLVQNLETQQHKLLNLVFFAQLEWMDVLQAAPNFEQRINMTYTLREIQLEETRRFVDFRLRQAGATGEPLFDEGSVAIIHAYAQGNPRVIVTVCRNALLVASQIRRRRVTPELVLHTIQKTTVPDADRRARAVAAAREVMRLNAPLLARDTVERHWPAEPARPATDTREALPRLSTARERRASEMLLRAAKTKQPPIGKA